MFLPISWKIYWNEWPRIWHTDVFRWHTPQSLSTPMGIVVISQCLSVYLDLGICWQIEWKEWPTISCARDFPSVVIDADGYYCHFMHSSICPSFRGFQFGYLLKSRLEGMPYNFPWPCIQVTYPKLLLMLMDIIVISCVHLSVHLFMALVLGICWKIVWMEWLIISHACVSIWLTLIGIDSSVYFLHSSICPLVGYGIGVGLG